MLFGMENYTAPFFHCFVKLKALSSGKKSSDGRKVVISISTEAVLWMKKQKQKKKKGHMDKIAQSTDTN